MKNVGHIEPFLATNSMHSGDLLLLHVGQQNKNYESGVYAIGEIVGEPYILRDSPDDYCNNKNTVDVKIIKISYAKPYITHEDCKEFINQFRTVHKINPIHYKKIMSVVL